MYQISETGFLREAQILPQHEVTEEEASRNRAVAANGKHCSRPKRARPASPGIIPVSHSTWWNGVKSGRFPKPVKIGRCTFWRCEDIRALIASA